MGILVFITWSNSNKNTNSREQWLQIDPLFKNKLSRNGHSCTVGVHGLGPSGRLG